MKSRFKILGITTIIMVILFYSGCVSLEGISNGQSLRAYIGEYNSSMSLNEHSFLINCANAYTAITAIDGINYAGNLIIREIIILQPGECKVSILNQTGINTTYTSTAEINTTLEPGQYYYLSQIGNYVFISNIRDVNEVNVPTLGYSSISVSSESLISGIMIAVNKIIK